MNEHRPQVAGTSDKAAKVAGAAAANAKTALEQNAAEAHEPPRELRDVIDCAKDAAGEALASVAKNVGEQARDRVAATAETLRQQTRRAGDSLSRRAGANSWAALLVAGAVGYGFGYLLHHTRRTPPKEKTSGVENT